MENSRKGIGGPKTDEGKRKVSLNAMKNGLHAKSQQAMEILMEEIGQGFDDLHATMRDHFKPKDPLEELLVRKIARAAWRSMLTEAVEERELSIASRPKLTNRYEKMIRSERIIDIQLHRAICALERKRQLSNKENKKITLPLECALSHNSSQEN